MIRTVCHFLLWVHVELWIKNGIPRNSPVFYIMAGMQPRMSAMFSSLLLGGELVKMLMWEENTPAFKRQKKEALFITAEQSSGYAILIPILFMALPYVPRQPIQKPLSDFVVFLADFFF